MQEHSKNILFPFYQFFAFDDDNLHSYECVKNRIYVPKDRKHQHIIKKSIDESIEIEIFINQDIMFREDLLRIINTLNPHLLFETLLSRILLLTFNPKIEKIKLEEISSNFIGNKREFVNLLNHRIDLIEIEQILKEFENNQNIKVNSKHFLNEIILFTYKFLFIKIAETIYYYHSNKNNGFKKIMNIKEHCDFFLKYSNDIKTENYNQFNYENKQDYISSFINSFRNNNQNFIEKNISELLLFSDYKQSKSKLINLIKKNIKINTDLSNTEKNKVLFPFYKNIIIIFFYRENLSSSEEVLRTKFRKFINSYK